jgi:dephospho-CoA kinase
MDPVNALFAIVGMAGSGKSAACDTLRDLGWGYIRFGQITIDRLKEEGREITEENEKQMREKLREEHGMGAFAVLSLPKIEKALEDGPVVIDGLYSWSEYKILKEKFRDHIKVIHVYTSPEVRYRRLDRRNHVEADGAHRMRRLTPQEAKKRDYAEIENIEKGGPIAMADFTVVNEDSLDYLQRWIRELASGRDPRGVERG